MARIALCRTGTILYGDNADASPVAGNQDALGLLRYLMDAGHDVCVFGRSSGDFPCPVFSPDYRGMDEDDDYEDSYRPAIEAQIERVKEWRPDVVVNPVGACPTISVGDNPWGVLCQSWAMRSVSPCLLLCEALQLKRICIVNDPRNYAKDHEIHILPHARPVAFLSQEARSFPRTIRGRRFMVHGVDSGAENWWSYGMPVHEPGGEGSVVIAHSHFGDSRINRGRAEAWAKIREWYAGESLTTYGKGWGKDVPVLKHSEVQGVLRDAADGPMIPIASDFNTGKLREYAIAGCLPRPAVTETHTYDAREKYVPLDHHTRVRGPWDTMRDDGWVRHLQEATTPDFSLLEECIAALDDLPVYEKFGGLE